MFQVCPYSLMEAPHTCGVGTVHATCVNCLVALQAPTTVSLPRGFDTAVVLAAGKSVGVIGLRAAEDLTRQHVLSRRSCLHVVPPSLAGSPRAVCGSPGNSTAVPHTTRPVSHMPHVGPTAIQMPSHMCFPAFSGYRWLFPTPPVGQGSLRALEPGSTTRHGWVRMSTGLRKSLPPPRERAQP